MGKSRKETFETVENYDAEGNLIVTSEYGDIVATEEVSDGVEENVDNETLKRIKKKAVKRRKIRKALRRSRLRRLKNFFWWVTGVLSSFAVLATSIFIAVGVIPVGTFFKDDEAVSEKVTDLSVLGIVQKFDQFAMSDFPVLQDTIEELLVSSGVDNYIVLNKEKFSELQFAYEDGDKTFGSEILNCFSLSPDILGEIGDDIGVFEYVELSSSEQEKINAIDTSNPPEDFKPELYCYVVTPVGASTLSQASDEPTYAPAFDENGNRVPDSVGKQLYYFSLSHFSVGEVMDVIGSRLGKLELTQLMTVFDANLEDSLIGEILGDTSISTIGDFEFVDISLGKIIPYEEQEVIDGEPQFEADGVTPIMKNVNEDIYDILCAAIETDGEPLEPADVKIGHLTGELGELVIDNIPLSVVGINEDSGIIYDILHQATGSDNPTLSELDGLDIGNVSLSAVIPYEEQEVIDGVPQFEADGVTPIMQDINEDIYDILCSACAEVGAPPLEKEDIKLGHLTGELGELNIDNISLSVVGINEDSGMIYDILYQATGNENPTLSELDGLNIDNVSLSVVIPYEEQEVIDGVPQFEADGVTPKMQDVNEDIYDILCSACAEEGEPPLEKADIKISHLSQGGFETNNIKITDVIDDTPDNEKLFTILVDATGVPKDQMTIEHFGDFNTDNIKLTNVIDANDPLNDKLYAILRDVTGVDKADITIENLNGFEPNKIRLDSVIPSTESANNKLYAILQDVTGVANKTDITIENLNGFEPNKIRLDSVIPSDDPLNNKLYAILQDVTDGKAKDKITIQDLNEFEPNKIKLGSVIDSTDPNNAKLYEILEDATGYGSDTITIENLNGFEVAGIKLTTVDIDAESGIYKILESALVETSADGITLGDLTRDVEPGVANFQINNIELSAVGITTESGTIYTILKEATGKDDPTIGNLTGNFTVGNIKLETVLTGVNTSGNVIFTELLKDRDLTVDGLPNAVNSLEFSVLHPDSIFKKDAEGSEYTKVTKTTKADGTVRVYYFLTSEFSGELPADGLDDGTYIYAVESGYKIENSAGVWTFLLMDYEIDSDLRSKYGIAADDNHDENGNALIYTEKHLTIGELSNPDGGLNSVGEAIVGAKIMQLVDCGFLGGIDNEGILAMSINELIAFVEGYI